MRFVVVFALVVGVALGATLLTDEEEAGQLHGGVFPEQASPLETELDVDPTPTPGPTPTPTPVPPTRVRIAFSGEILSHVPVIGQAAANGTARRPHDYRPMFRAVRPIFEEVDLAICHLETPISSDNADLSGYPVFNAPRDLARNIAEVGYDGCSTASNHSYDRGPDGIVSTLDQLESAGVGFAGMARSRTEDDRPVLYRAGEVSIGHLSFTYGLNGFSLPVDEPYLVDVTDVDEILAKAARARAAGADIVVLSMQWGNEYQVDPSEEQRSLARTLIASDDIDLIIGAHVHVVQPVERIGREFVVYGLGNFLSNQSAECCPDASQNGIIAVAEITGTEADGYRVGRMSFVPTRVDRSDYTIVALPQALAGDDLDPATRATYEAVVESTTEVVNRLGLRLRLFGEGR